MFYIKKRIPQVQEQTSSRASAFITTREAKTRESRPSQANVGGEGSDVNSLTRAARFPRRVLHMLVSLEWLCERQSESCGAKRPVSFSLSLQAGRACDGLSTVCPSGPLIIFMRV